MYGTGEATILHRLRNLAENRPEHEAFIFVSPKGDREVLTWKTLYVNICRTAAGFIDMGLKAKEYVRINLQNCPECLYAIYGTMMVGAIPCIAFFCFQDGSDFLALMEQLKTCSMFIVDPSREKEEWELMKQFVDKLSNNGTVSSSTLPYLRYVLCNEEGLTKETAHLKCINQLVHENKHVQNFALPVRDDVSVAIATSGSTGFPKLVLRNLYGQSEGNYRQAYKIYSDRRFSSVSGIPFDAIIQGNITVTMKGPYKSNEYAELRTNIIRQEGCKMTILMTAEILELIEYQNKLPQDWPLKVVLLGGQPLLSNVSKCLGKAASSLMITYSSTECGVVSSYHVSDPSQFKSYLSGSILPERKVKIVDESENEQPVNTRGEIFVKAPTMFNGYVNDPSATEAAFDDEGWYKTGDIGLVNENGKLYVFGRKSNIIITVGSNQIQPDVIESKLVSCENVKDAVVVPVFDEKHYQMMCACIIPISNRGITADKLRVQLESKFIKCDDGKNCFPKYYMFFESFPTTHNGKTSRKKLEAIAAEMFNESPKANIDNTQ